MRSLLSALAGFGAALAGLIEIIIALVGSDDLYYARTTVGLLFLVLSALTETSYEIQRGRQ